MKSARINILDFCVIKDTRRTEKRMQKNHEQTFRNQPFSRQLRIGMVRGGGERGESPPNAIFASFPVRLEPRSFFKGEVGDVIT